MSGVDFVTSILAACFAIATGAAVAHKSGFNGWVYLPNVLAVVLGSVGLFRAKQFTGVVRRRPVGASLVVLALMTLTLIHSGQDSVHRWITMGPVRLNVSMAFTPVFLYLLWELKGLSAAVLGIGFSLFFVFQPDAGQAMAFTVGATFVLALDRSFARPLRMATVVCLICAAAIAWYRPDPLLPVAYVERTLRLAFSGGALFICSAALSVFLLLFPFARSLWRWRGSPSSSLAAGYLGFVAMSFLVTELGSFPVPVLGAGAAPVLGWFLALTLLSGAESERP